MSPKPSRKLRVAISGYGWIAKHRHVPCFTRNGASIVGVYRTAFDELPKGAALVEEYEDLLALKPDIVAVCSPPWAHAEQTIRALESGAHVLVEKPMAMDAAQAHRMADASRRSGKLLSVAHSHLFDRATIKARKLVESNEIGDVTSVNAIFYRGALRDGKPWLFDLPGGLSFDELPHPVYLLETFLGRLDLRSVDVQKVPGRNTPRQINAMLEGPKGAGGIMMVMDSPVSEWHLVIAGTREMLIIDLFRDVLVRIPTDRDHKPSNVLKTSMKLVSTHLGGVISSGAKYARGGLFYGHDVLIDQFVNAVTSGTNPPVSIESAVRTQELVDLIIAPARERQSVPVG